MSYGRVYDDHSSAAVYGLKMLCILIWCGMWTLLLADAGPIPFLALGVPLMLFVLLPPIKFSRGGSIRPRHRFRWKRRAYRLSDFPRILFRARLAFPALMVLLLLLITKRPADLGTYFTVVGMGVWAIWLALRYSSQRGEIAWPWVPLQALPFAMLLLCLVFVMEPQATVDVTKLPGKRAGHLNDSSVELCGLRFGVSAHEFQPIIPRSDPEPEEPETLMEQYERHRIKAEWLQRRLDQGE